MSIQHEIIDTHVHKITLDRPEVLNAFNFEMMEAFDRAVAAAGTDPEARALILTGAGERGFSTGGDLKALASHTSRSDGRRISVTMQKALEALETLPVPTIAAINGHTRGGGAEIALACDFRLMSADATIGFTHMNVAVSTAWGGARRLLRTVGYAAAIDLVLMARVLSADRAHQIGLVHDTASADQLMGCALALAGEIAALPPQTARAIKEILLAGAAPESDEASRLERERFPMLWAHPDHQVQTEAFLNRKK